MTQSFQKELDDLKGVPFKYDNLVFTLNSWRKREGKYILETDRRTFVLFQKELKNFLYKITKVENGTSWEPKTLPEIPLNPPEDTVEDSDEEQKVDLAIYEPTTTQKELQESLMDALKKVQENPNYIPQAKAVCDIGNTIINMEKNQIQLMNAVKRKTNKK
jgi:hypothetical protein